MGKYSIKELEKLSGIKAHTIRIWEKRHQIIRPARTDTNIRYYSDDDLKKIINIAFLNHHGLKISKIAGLSSGELHEKVMQLSDTHGTSDTHIDQLIVAMIDLDEVMFEQTLAGLILRYGFEKTILTIVYPFLEKIGVLWLTHNITPAQEHFISVLIRQKIIVAIDALPLVPKSKTGVLLFLPEEELHEIGLLFYHYIVKKEGFKTYYLGQMVPQKDLSFIYAIHKPGILITSITSFPAVNALQGYLNKLCKEIPKSSILVSGAVFKKVSIKKPSNLHVFGSVPELQDLIRSYK